MEESIDPDSVEDFAHVEKNWAGEPLLAEIPGYSFIEVGQLQGRAMPGSEPKILVSHQFEFAC